MTAFGGTPFAHPFPSGEAPFAGPLALCRREKETSHGRQKKDQKTPAAPSDSGRPETGSGEGRRDVTGVMPDNVRVDPNITEGHPGYQESGDSEIIPPPNSTTSKPAEK